MNDSDKYILAAIKTWVWSGFYDADRVQEMIDDILEEDADEDLLRAAVAPEFAAKAAAEKSWPRQTDCDRLDAALDELDAGGVIALHNAGYTMSDGISDVNEVLHQRSGKAQGYCFYHGQDLERAVDGFGLTLAFGSVDDDPAKKRAMGKLVKQVLEKHGFAVAWNGDPETRIDIPKLDWKRRLRQ